MGLIKNQPAADAIATMLANPLHHPGNPDTKEPAADLVIPMFATKGKPPPIADAIKVTTQTIAEAIVYYVEKTLDCSIVPNAELAELRGVVPIPAEAEPEP